MADKKVVAVTAILIVGAALVLLFDRRTETFADPRLGRAILETEDVLAADRLEIRRGDRSIVMAKDGASVWRLGDGRGFPADAAKIIQLMDALGRSKLTMVMGTKKQAFADFGLEEPTSVKLTLQDKDLATIHLGQPRKGGGQYVALGGEYKAYLADQPVPITVDEDSWELKALLGLAKADVKSVAFFPADPARGGPVTLAREKPEEPMTVAGLSEPQAAKPSAAAGDEIVERLTFSRRLDPSHEEAKAALGKPSKVFITMFDGRTYEVLVGHLGESSKRYFLAIHADRNGATLDDKQAAALDALKAAMAAHSFEVPAWVAQRYERGRTDFVEDRPTP